MYSRDTAEFPSAGTDVVDLLRELSSVLGLRCTTGGGELCMVLDAGEGDDEREVVDEGVDGVPGVPGVVEGVEGVLGVSGRGSRGFSTLGGVVKGKICPDCDIGRGGVLIAFTLPGTFPLGFRKLLVSECLLRLLGSGPSLVHEFERCMAGWGCSDKAMDRLGSGDLSTGVEWERRGTSACWGCVASIGGRGGSWVSGAWVLVV